MYAITVKDKYVDKSFRHGFHFKLTESLLKAKTFTRKADAEYRLNHIKSMCWGLFNPEYKGAFLGKNKRSKRYHAITGKFSDSFTDLFPISTDDIKIVLVDEKLV